MWYSIPVSKLAKLEKIIAKYQKKGANLTFTIGEDVVEDGTLFVTDYVNHYSYNMPIKVACKKVFVDGSYQYNGWSFVGTVEFTDNGNIIRLADSSFEGKVPAKYLHTKKICEHCGTIRNRKDTYLIYNAEQDKFMQVGSSCLLDYTMGMDANMCAEMMACFNRVKEISDRDFSDSDFCGNGYDSTGCGMNRDTILPVAYAYVKQYGYQRMFEGKGTAHDVLIMLWHGMHDEEMIKRYESLKMPSDEELKAIDTVAQNYINQVMANAEKHIYNYNEYMYNASLAWLKSEIEYRDFGLVASFVNSCLKQFAKDSEKKQRNNEWVGNVGDRITIKVASARVLYTRDNSWKSYYAGCSYVNEIIDKDGHVYIWSSSEVVDMYIDDKIHFEDDEGKLHSFKDKDGYITIVATVKSHSEYKGVKQTVITRGKITQ